MVGSRVSSRIAQRLIKQENNDGSDDMNDRQSSGHQSSTPLIETPKKSSNTRRHTIITSSPSSVEEEDVFDRNSMDDIEDEEDDDEEEEVVVPTPLRRRGSYRTHRMNQLNQTKRRPSLGEVDSARHKLDDLLAHISKGDSHEEEDYDEDEEQTDSSPHMKRRRSRTQKKDRKDSKEDGFTKSSSFVLKLFDRSVDLAQFSLSTTSADSPLYPVCRSWIRNNSQLPNLYESPPIEEYNEDLETSDEKPTGIYHLPKPLPKPKDKYGNEIDLRIPESVRNYPKQESKADLSINSLADENFSSLLNKNLNHWKTVRHEWQMSALKNELRYKHSCDVLKAMFDKSVNGQPEQLKPQAIDSTVI